MEDQKLTFGQKAVGLTFNPSGDDKVNTAKQLLADAIDLLEEAHTEAGTQQPSTWFRNVLRTSAFSTLVAGQMALVKYLTWRD